MVDGNGKVSEFISETALRHNRGEISEGNALSIGRKTVNTAEDVAAKDVTIEGYEY